MSPALGSREWRLFSNFRFRQSLESDGAGVSEPKARIPGVIRVRENSETRSYVKAAILTGNRWAGRVAYIKVWGRNQEEVTMDILDFHEYLQLSFVCISRELVLKQSYPLDCVNTLCNILFYT